MFKKSLKLRTQLNLGFAAVIVLLVVVSGTAYWGLKGAFEGFTEYRRIARMTKEVGKFQDNMLQVRLAVKDFIAKENDLAVQMYQKKFGEIRADIARLKGEIKNPERLKLIGAIDEQTAKYDEIFKRVVESSGHRRTIVDLITNSGMAMRQTVSEIIASSAKSNNVELAVLAGQLQEQVMLGRLYLVKYLESHAAADYGRALDEMKVEAEALADTLFHKEVGVDLRALHERFDQSHGKYLAL
ncbi:MAG: MCP four helix bundle domain-containing protein, partial [Candidatus Competibacter sp.]|nr:MCP four helix bundle domain-containing protein [Candidatus Competibacter sp.]